jgi:hypothetical protein
MGCISSCFLCLNIKEEDNEEYIENNEIFLNDYSNNLNSNNNYLNYYLSNRFNNLD